MNCEMPKRGRQLVVLSEKRGGLKFRLAALEQTHAQGWSAAGASTIWDCIRLLRARCQLPFFPANHRMVDSRPCGLFSRDAVELRRYAMTQKMRINPVTFNDGDPIPSHFAVDGDNVSPALQWVNVPEGAQELALLVEDPDGAHAA